MPPSWFFICYSFVLPPPPLFFCTIRSSVRLRLSSFGEFSMARGSTWMASGVLSASICFAVATRVDGVFLFVLPSALSGCFGVSVSIGDLSILLLLRKAMA